MAPRIFVAMLVLPILASCTASGDTSDGSPRAERETELTETNTPSENHVGDYLCTVIEKAAIESFHFENANPPKAAIDDRLPTRFKMRIAVAEDIAQDYRLTELPYDGADRDSMEWHTPNTILHGPYVGNDESFSATDEDSEAFFVFSKTMHNNEDGDYGFYHAGFEWPGGEDTNL